MEPKLTIGMACYDDFQGVLFTVQALRMFHRDAMGECEILVVDNNPGSREGERVRNFMVAPMKDLAGHRYIAAPEATGTSAPRDRVFREASGEAVVCIDCHILIQDGGVRRLLDYYAANPETRDLLSGPLLYDGLDTYSTHFQNVWQDQMWGVWGSAWWCPCGDFVFDVNQGIINGQNICLYRGLFADETDFVRECPKCGKSLPVCPYPQHERVLEHAGYGVFLNQPPFEIPACGLGLFSCRKDAWLGFNPKFRGFGGEEWYIHTKVRQAGAKCLCLPWLGWFHRFSGPPGDNGKDSTAPKYPLTVWHKVRNYVIGHTEVGLPLDRIHKHFCEQTRAMDQTGWDMLTKNPADPPEWPPASGTPCQSPGCQGFKAPAETLDAWFDTIKTQQHDFSGYEDLIRSLASGKQVTELGGRRSCSTVALLAGNPATFRLIDPQAGGEWPELVRLAAQTQCLQVPLRSEVAQPEPTDLLFVDTTHHGNQLRLELATYAPHVRERIVIHDTMLHGSYGEHGGPGLMPAILEFLEKNPEWTVASHDPKSYGLMVLSRAEEDKEELPGLTRRGLNFIKALGRRATGAGDVSEEVQRKRMELCLLCEDRNGLNCARCGCPISAKSAWATEMCPDRDSKTGEARTSKWGKETP